MSFNIPVFYGSVRTERQGIKAARFIQKKLKERGHDAEIIDPLTYDLPMLDKMYKELDKSPDKLEKLAEIIKAADAYVVVTAEYNHTAPPALLNIMDHFLEEYFFKPSAIVSYSAGPWGGVRAASHLRDTLAEMGMPAIPTSMPIPQVQDAFDDLGKPNDDAWDRRSKKFLDELEWYARAFKAEREKGTPY